MRSSTLLFTGAITALLAVSTTAWPFFHPPHFPFFPPHFPFFPPHFPIFPPHPSFPFPPGGGSAPPPSSGSASVDSVSSESASATGDVSTTNFWPFFPRPHFPIFPPHFPIFPPHPTFPFPPGGGSAPPPSSVSDSVDGASGSGFPSFPPPGDVKKCLKVLHHSGLESCFHHKFDAGKCCTYLSGLEDSCTYVPFYKSHFFRGILKHVCDAGSAPPPSS